MNTIKFERFYHCFASAFILAVSLLAGGNGKAQDINFRNLTIDDGLSQNAVYSILQDSRGFKWFGIRVQFVREQCVEVMSAKTNNPNEERGAVNRLGLSFTNELSRGRSHEVSTLNP